MKQTSDYLNMPITLIGHPYLFGRSTPSPGFDMVNGPRLLLADENVPAKLREAFSDVQVVMLEGIDEPSEEDTNGDHRIYPTGDQMSRSLVQSMRLAKTIIEVEAAGRLPVISLGTCSSAMGVVATLPEGVGVVWFDAHGDADTPETTINGVLEQMAVAVVAGKCWTKYAKQIPGFNPIPEERIVSVSLHQEFATGESSGMTIGNVVSPLLIKKHGFFNALESALEDLATRCSKVYVHVDTDVLDPSVLRANSHCFDGGLTDKQVMEGIQMVADRFEIVALAFASFDPGIDPRGASVLTPMLADAAHSFAQSRARA